MLSGDSLLALPFLNPLRRIFRPRATSQQPPMSRGTAFVEWYSTCSASRRSQSPSPALLTKETQVDGDVKGLKRKPLIRRLHLCTVGGPLASQHNLFGAFHPPIGKWVPPLGFNNLLPLVSDLFSQCPVCCLVHPVLETEALFLDFQL